MWTAEQRERYKDDGRRYPSDLTDAEWALRVPLIWTTERNKEKNRVRRGRFTKRIVVGGLAFKYCPP